MITNLNIISHNKKLNLDSDTVSRLLNYDLFRDLYDGNFKTAFAKTYSKICAKYPLDTTTSQTFVELNLFFAMTDFYKNLFTNQGVFINVNGKFQKIWDEIEKNNNFLSVLKEVFVDASRFGNGIFKSSFGKNGVEITSVSPSSWFPVFNKGNINDILGHIIINTLSDFVNGQKNACCTESDTPQIQADRRRWYNLRGSPAHVWQIFPVCRRHRLYPSALP